jgi:hypothetical protein
MGETRSTSQLASEATLRQDPPFIVLSADELLEERAPDSVTGSARAPLSTNRPVSISVSHPEAVIPSPRPSPPEVPQIVLQQWLGRIIEIRDTEFVANLHDQTNPMRPAEQVIVGLDEVDASDASLVVEGSVFYLFVVQEQRRGGRRVTTDLRFRRLARWSTSELKAIKDRAQRKARQLGIAAQE